MAKGSTNSVVDGGKDISVTIRNHCEGNSSGGYYDLVKFLEDKNVEDTTLVAWLSELRMHITFLDQRCESLVWALLQLPWTTYSQLLVKEYSSFLIHLVSAHPFYLKAVLRMLVKNFMTIETKIVDKRAVNIVNVLEDSRYINSHALLQGIIKIVPAAPSLLVNLLSLEFPFMRRSAQCQVDYVQNLLKVITYIGYQRQAILETIIDRLIKIDVHSPKNEINDAEERRELEGTENEAVFEMEIEDVQVTENLKMDGMAHDLANVLDLLMNIMFKYIRSVCFHPSTGEIDMENTKTLFADMWDIFEKLVLPTHSCCHIQFLWFYMCSFRPVLAEAFVDRLWKKVQNPNTPGILRQASASYIGSFLSRGVYIPLSLATSVLDVMCPWIHRYITSQTDVSRNIVDMSVHAPFYSVCQNVLYVFIFYHQKLMERPNGFNYLQGLNFERMVTCRLNPLKMCLPAVVRKFASLARSYQLAYCYTIIEKNQRAGLPVFSSSTKFSNGTETVNPLDSFFPFDPYILKRSENVIHPLYKEYQEEVEECVQEDEQDDDFLSTDVNHDEPTSSSLMDFISCSVSPGFKVI